MKQDRAGIEQKLWEYIDGACSEEDQKLIAGHIQAGGIWKELYDEICVLREIAIEATHIEHPSMRFAKNVMDTIAADAIATHPKAYINLWVVKGIAAFFIITIGICLIGFFLRQNPKDWVLANDHITYPVEILQTAIIIKKILIPVNILAMILLADEWRKRVWRKKML